MQLTVQAEALACDGRRRDLGQAEIALGTEEAQPVMTTGELEQHEVLVFSWDGKGDGEGDGEGEAMTHAGEDHFAPRPYKQLPLADPGVRMTVGKTIPGRTGRGGSPDCGSSGLLCQTGSRL